MSPFINFLRERIPPWLLKYLPKWLLNWLYPPIPLYVNIHYARSPYFLLLALSAIAAAYMIYKLYNYFYSKDTAKDILDRNYKLLHLNTTLPRILIVPEQNDDVPIYNLTDSNRKSSDGFVKINRNESVGFDSDYEDSVGLDPTLYSKKNLDGHYDDFLVENLSDYYKFNADNEEDCLSTLSKASARKLAECDLQMYHELPF